MLREPVVIQYLTRTHRMRTPVRFVIFESGGKDGIGMFEDSKSLEYEVILHLGLI